MLWYRYLAIFRLLEVDLDSRVSGLEIPNWFEKLGNCLDASIHTIAMHQPAVAVNRLPR